MQATETCGTSLRGRFAGGGAVAALVTRLELPPPWEYLRRLEMEHFPRLLLFLDGRFPATAFFGAPNAQE